MKRRKFLSTVGITPLLALAACEKNLPSTPTIVTGKVTDENNLPVESFVFSFSGIDKKNVIAGLSTFSEKGKTSQSGDYKISVVIPNGTDYVEFVIEGFENNYPKTSMYNLYIEKNSIYEEYVQVGYGEIKYGETNTFNFQIRKK